MYSECNVIDDKVDMKRKFDMSWVCVAIVRSTKMVFNFLGVFGIGSSYQLYATGKITKGLQSKN